MPLQIIELNEHLLQEVAGDSHAGASLCAGLRTVLFTVTQRVGLRHGSFELGGEEYGILHPDRDGTLLLDLRSLNIYQKGSFLVQVDEAGGCIFPNKCSWSRSIISNNENVRSIAGAATP